MSTIVIGSILKSGKDSDNRVGKHLVIKKECSNIHIYKHNGGVVEIT